MNKDNNLIAPWDPTSPWPNARPWIWTILFLFVCIYQGPTFARSLKPARTEGTDFFQDWASARNYLEGFSIYENHRLSVERYLGHSTNQDNGPTVVEIEYNAHPPPSVFLALPFANIDYPDANLIWNIVSLAAFCLSIYLVAHHLSISFSIKAAVPFVTLCLIFDPFRSQCSQGQLGFIILLLIIGAWSATKSGHSLWAGLFLGMAIAIKLFPAFLLLYYLFLRRWRTLIAGVATFILASLITLFFFGFQTYLIYFNTVLPTVERFRGHWINQSLQGLWIKLFDPDTDRDHVQALFRSPSLAKGTILILSLVVVVVLIWAIRSARTEAEKDHAFGLAIVAMLLVSPITWNHYLVLLMLPLMTIWSQLPPAFAWRATFLLVVIALGIEPNLLYKGIPAGYGIGMATPIHTLTLLSVQLYGLIGLFGLGLAQAWTFRRTDYPLNKTSLMTS
jgi:hypothetical protein